MGRLENGAALMVGEHAQHFRNWLLVAAATTARTVIAESPETPEHAARLRLALDVLVSPQIVVDRLVTAVATDPQVVANPPTFAEAAEPVVQTKVDNVWTTIALLMYPTEEASP